MQATGFTGMRVVAIAGLFTVVLAGPAQAGRAKLADLETANTEKHFYGSLHTPCLSADVNCGRVGIVEGLDRLGRHTARACTVVDEARPLAVQVVVGGLAFEPRHGCKARDQQREQRDDRQHHDEDGPASARRRFPHNPKPRT